MDGEKKHRLFGQRDLLSLLGVDVLFYSIIGWLFLPGDGFFSTDTRIVNMFKGRKELRIALTSKPFAKIVDAAFQPLLTGHYLTKDVIMKHLNVFKEHPEWRISALSACDPRGIHYFSEFFNKTTFNFVYKGIEFNGEYYTDTVLKFPYRLKNGEIGYFKMMKCVQFEDLIKDFKMLFKYSNDFIKFSFEGAPLDPQHSLWTLRRGEDVVSIDVSLCSNKGSFLIIQDWRQGRFNRKGWILDVKKDEPMKQILNRFMNEYVGPTFEGYFQCISNGQAHAFDLDGNVEEASGEPKPVHTFRYWTHPDL